MTEWYEVFLSVEYIGPYTGGRPFRSSKARVPGSDLSVRFRPECEVQTWGFRFRPEC